MRWPSLIALLVLAGSAASAPAAQISAPVIQWQQSFGGTNDDYARAIRQTRDGGYVVAATSGSPPGGNKTSEHFGGLDFWLLRLDSVGNKLWERAYGGSGYDLLYDLQVTADGGFVLAGYSESPTNAIKAGMNLGSSDCWLLRLDAAGNKIWDKTYGGTGQDLAAAVTLMSDGGFVVAGQSSSATNANKSSPHFGGGDYWVFRTDADGNLLWDRSFGGSAMEEVWSICQAEDGSIVVGGSSMSWTDGNKTSPNLGGNDFWLVALNAAGEKLWEKSYGGSAHDNYPGVTSLAAGGYLLAGPSGSLPGPNKDAPYFGGGYPNGWPGGDFWLVKTDGVGNRVADQSFGGDSYDLCWDVIATADGSFLTCGLSTSGVSGNKATLGFGGGDAWLVRLDSNLNKVWELSLGGTLGDQAKSVRQTSDGGFVLACESSSGPNGIKTTPAFGSSDVWIVKLGPDALTAPQLLAIAQTADKIRESGFHLELRPPPNAPASARYVLEASTNKTNWTAIQTSLLNPGASVIELVDPSATNLPARVYRARMER